MKTWWNPTAKRRIAWSLPGLLLALAVGIKMVSMVAVNMSGVAAYDSASYGLAAQRFGSLQTLNVFERWVGPYNHGTSLYQLGDYPRAEQELRTALQVAPPNRDCRVRLNLVAAIEAHGDQLAANKDATGAQARYAEALTVLRAGDCRGRDGSQESEPSPIPSSGPSSEPENSPSAEPSPGTDGQPTSAPDQLDEQRQAAEGKAAKEAEKRILDKASKAGKHDGNDTNDDPDSAEPDKPSQDTEDSEQQRQGQMEKRSKQAQHKNRERQDGNEQPPGDRTDRPW